MQDSEEMEQDVMDFMLHSLPCPLRADAYKLIPSIYWRKCTCCVIYDGHPSDDKKIDITICLEGGKVLELYQREPVSWMKVPHVPVFKDIRMLRNNKGALFYLVASPDHLFIFPSKNKISTRWSLCKIKSYDICDPQCSGEPKLMVKTDSQTHYMAIANNFEMINLETKRKPEHTKPVIIDLKKQLTEAQYNLQCNEKTYRNIETLRQQANFLCKDDVLLQTPKPTVRFCNQKIVILLEIENPYNESMENVCVMIHNSSCISISYATKVYEGLQSSPFYREIQHREIKRKSKSSVAAVIPIREFKNTVSSKIEFSVIITYERQGKDYLKPFDNIKISAADVMGKDCDVFNSLEVDDHNMVLAMLATTTKTTLCLKQKGIEESIMDPPRIFCKYLKMHLLRDLNDVAIHKHFPHHILHGMMLIFDEYHNYYDAGKNEFNFKLDAYSRSPSQIRALVHFIYDKIPLTLIVTTPNINLNSHKSCDNGARKNLLNFDCTPCAESLLKQCSMTLKYLGDCKKEMSKKSAKHSKSIEQIDLLAMGQEEFVKYRNNMLAEAESTFGQIVKSSHASDVEDVMEIDDNV